MATLKAEITDQDEPIVEVPSWSEVSSLPDFQKLSYPEQRRIALDWAGDVKREASYRGEFTEDEAKEVDDFVANAVQPDIETKAKAAAEGVIRGGLAGAAATLAGRVGFAAPLPAIPRAIVGLGASAVASAGVDELARRGIAKFAPGLTEAAELAPEYATGGQIAGMAGSAAPAISRTAKALSTIAKAEGGKAAVQQGAKLLVPAAAIGAATDTGIRAITGQEITPGTVASSALLNTLFAGYGANTRIANYTRDEARDLFKRVIDGKGGLTDTDDLMAVINEMQRKSPKEMPVQDFERARRTTVDILGKRVVDKTRLEGSKFQTSQDSGAMPPRLQASQPTVIPQEQLPEAGVRGIVRGTQADTAAMQRRGITTQMQESLVDLNDPVPRTNVFTTESQGINREAIIPDTRGLQGEIVREGPIVTPRTQLPTTERLALPGRTDEPFRSAEEAAKTIELEKGMEERIRQSPQGGRGLRKDLRAQEPILTPEEEMAISERQFEKERLVASNPSQDQIEYPEAALAEMIEPPYRPIDLDVIDFIIENKGILSKTSALRKKNLQLYGKKAGPSIKRLAEETGVAEYDSMPEMDFYEKTQVYRKQGLALDEMAQMAYDQLGVGDGTSSTFGSLIAQALAARRKLRTPDKGFESQKKFIKDALIPSKGLTPISAQSLVVGDILQAKQGDIRVIDINPDTMEPILDGGDNYGQQTIKTDSHVFVKTVNNRSIPTIPRPMRGRAGEEGMVAGELLTKPAELYKTFLTSTGDLPKKLFDIVEARGTQTQAMLKQVQFTARDIESEIKKALAGTSAKDRRTAEIDIRQKISLVERGQAAPETLPENVAGVVVQMRRQIDNLSDALIESGVFSEELPIEKNKFGGYDVVGPSPAQRVRENRGAYITRTYERDYNPKFSGRTLQKRDAAKYAQAESMLREELKASRPNITEQEIKAELELISQYSKEKLSPSQKVTGLGKDLGVTKQRQEIPWYRKYLMGETTEPVANYVISASRMIELLQTQRMLNSIRSDGLGKYLFEKPTGNATEAIAAEGSQTLAPLNGLYADPKLVSALKDVDSVANLNLPAKMYALANSFVKMGKTVLSVQAQFRNPVANIAIEIANGNPFFIPTPSNIGAITKSVKAIWADWGVPAAQKPEYKQYLKKAISLGIYDNTAFNELRDVIRDAQGFSGDGMEFATKILENGLKKFAMAPIRGAMDTYKANDNFFKLIGWEHEIKQLMDGTGITREQAEPLAAELVKNTRPTYSRVPPLIKKFRQQPFFGNFISWPSEIVRTMFNMAKVSYDQIRTPGMEYYGYKRALLGIATIAGVSYASGKLGQLIAGVTKEKIDAIRRFVAPYQKNAELMPISKNNKEMSYIDISYTSPWEIFYQPYRAAMSGENFEESLLGATQEFLESYASPGILTAAAASTVFGQTPSGKKIRNPEDPPGDQFLDTLSYFIRQIEPATASQIRRNYYGFTGQTDPLLSGYGRVYNASEEALALLGVRPSSINYAKALEGKSSRFNTRMSDVSRIFTEQYGSVGSKPPSEIKNAYSTMDRQRKKLFNEANKDYHASMVLGLSRSEAISAMRAGGISEANALAISKNKYTDYQISRDLSQTMKDTLKPEELRKREAIARELRIKER